MTKCTINIVIYHGVIFTFVIKEAIEPSGGNNCDLKLSFPLLYVLNYFPLIIRGLQDLKTENKKLEMHFYLKFILLKLLQH